MRQHPTIEPVLPVDTVMRQWPPTLAVFTRHGMLCIGCAFGTYCSISDGCSRHDVDLAVFMAELREVIAKGAAAEVPLTFAGAAP